MNFVKEDIFMPGESIALYQPVAHVAQGNAHHWGEDNDKKAVSDDIDHSTAIWLQTEYIAHTVYVEHNWLLNFFLVLFFIYGFQGATHFLFILFI